MSYKIAVIPGDGIGPEIVKQARRVLDQAAAKFGFELEYTELLMGGASIDVNGVPLTDETIAAAKASDAVLMGSIGG
ncbi:MAG: 3-isopropylmalate dehydrogenase, partial [Clostridiales bacterium]|nr:3-isopropylmalate dehydrogenase [Clostridiales bacterium]